MILCGKERTNERTYTTTKHITTLLLHSRVKISTQSCKTEESVQQGLIPTFGNTEKLTAGCFLFQLAFENFCLGRLESQAADGCPDGHMQILELGRPFTGGSWCGKSDSLAVYYSESSTVTLTIRLFYTGRFTAIPFEFKLRYKFIKKEEASTRFGSAAAPIERGEIIPGTYCSRNFYECYRKKCQVQSPNYPGIYPRNVTCLYQIRQKTVPKCKHGMILVRQTNKHKMKLKRSADEALNKTEPSLRVWQNCDDTKDRIIFYDGLTTEDSILFKFCGGSWLPPVLSRGPQMLVVFHSSATSVPLQSKESTSLLKGFELDADTVFTDSDSFDFSRHRFRYEFWMIWSWCGKSHPLWKFYSKRAALVSPREPPI